MKTNSILNLIVSETEKIYLSEMNFIGSFIKSKAYIYSLYKLRLEVSEEVTHKFIPGLKELLSHLEDVAEDQQIAVHVFKNKENDSCGVFTDDGYTICYGLVKSAIDL